MRTFQRLKGTVTSSSLQEEFGDEINPEEQLEFFRQFGCAGTQLPLESLEGRWGGPVKMEAL